MDFSTCKKVEGDDGLVAAYVAVPHDNLCLYRCLIAATKTLFFERTE